MSQGLLGTTPPLPSSALICPPPAYVTTMTILVGSLFILCFLASACVAAVVAAAAVAAGVIKARSVIVAIEWEDSKPSFNALGQFVSAVQADGLCHACHGSPGGGSGGGYSSLPTAKVDKKTMHQSTSTAGDKEVSGRSRGCTHK
jgi:hypothetical protein